MVAEYAPFPGRGKLGLVASLFVDGPLEAIPMAGTNYRAHRCPGTGAFAAANFSRKTAAK